MKKICKRCGRNRKIGKFGSKTSSPDGKNYYCKDCMRILNKRYKNTLRGKLKQKKCKERYKSKNKEKIKEFNKEYYIKNRERILYNKRCREDTESVLITESSEKKGQTKINKDRIDCIIKIDPKRK